jgi:hypothetical protein
MARFRPFQHPEEGSGQQKEKNPAQEDGHAESKSSARRRKTARSTVAANDHRKFLQKVTGQNRGILFSSASNKRAPNSVATASQQVT